MTTIIGIAISFPYSSQYNSFGDAHLLCTILIVLFFVGAFHPVINSNYFEAPLSNSFGACSPPKAVNNGQQGAEMTPSHGG